MNLRAFLVLTTVALGLGMPSWAQTQTYRHTWTTTADFETGSQINVTARSVDNQLQLNLSQIETPYLWVANAPSSTVSRMDTATGRVLSTTLIGPTGNSSPSRTAVDLDFNCWVALRVYGGRVYKLDSDTGEVAGISSFIGRYPRGVAINAEGHVWASSSANSGYGFGWQKLNAETLEPLDSFQNNFGSYGLVVGPFGKTFSPTGWLGGNALQRFDSIDGTLEQTWTMHESIPESLYGVAIDIDGNIWAGIRGESKVAWIDGDYQCPNNAETCEIDVNSGIHRIIDLEGVLESTGANSTDTSARGIAVDANNFVWVVVNSRIEDQPVQSYAIKIDNTTGDPILAVPVGLNAVGVTSDANGFIWVVNEQGGGANLVEYPCPNEEGDDTNGTVTKLRSSDGSVVATYKTCGNGPYTYSDMAGYNLRSVTLRSGTWRSVHDSGRDNLEWGRIDWNGQEFNDTTLRIRARAANSREELPLSNFVTLRNGANLPFRGRFIEVEAFFFTRNDFLGPVLEDLTVSSVCFPQPEVCNGSDDDCNGIIDDGNPGGGGGCQTGLAGICALGHEVCRRGRFECHPTETPGREICDGIDNNCDGRIDEGVQNFCGSCGPIPEEICNGIDDDCDGLTDENLLNACGECGPAPTEICNGIDDDCDGLTDEGLLNACGECGETPTEICNGIDDDCNGIADDGVLNACGGCGPLEEICNGIDDDCDGEIDDGVLNACGGCGPLEEVCNGLDDDCNGEVDDGVLNACGFCGPVPEEICDGQDNDCDGETDEGILNACGSCGPVPEETCNGLDDDCDGQIDEGVANACGNCGIVPEEICDGEDNDCDGQIDEGVKNACGGCGEVPREICDGEDNNCDGLVDEGKDIGCEGRALCVEGICAEPCSIEGECARGHFCREGFCVLDRCIGVRCEDGESCEDGTCLDENQILCREVTCEDELVCIGGNCQEDPCPSIECPEGESCWLGECLPEGEALCRQTTCRAAEICDENGACIPDPCLGVECFRGEICIDGTCEDACLHKTCNTGFECRAGQCVEDLCFDLECGPGRACHLGNCIYEACIDLVCAEDEQCGPNGCEPLNLCGDSVCVGEERCFDGVCALHDPNKEEDTETPEDSISVPPSGSNNDATCVCQTPGNRTQTSFWWILGLVGFGALLRRQKRSF